jgi:hypothetical protein
MISRASLFTSLLSLSLLAPLGCAVTAAETPTDDVAATQDEITLAAASALAGNYYRQAAGISGFARLELRADGTYAAQIDLSAVALCANYPCLAPESGRWSASPKAGGGHRLRLRPTGEAARFYDAARTSSALVLSRGGVTETLIALDPDQCLDDADCGAGQTCGEKVCLMWCEVDDPFCCGPSVCEPAPPPPTTDCGPVQCGAGEVCCNPLDGICTPPGWVCTQ